MKNKLSNLALSFIIIFILSPYVLYFILSSSLYNEYNLYFDKYSYITAYFNLVLILLIFIFAFSLFKRFLLLLQKNNPTERAELISIEKISNDYPALLNVDKANNYEYNVKFKHKNQVILLKVSKESIKRDLNANEPPYVEYQYFNLTSIFSKFHNIKVHTK